MLREWLWGTQLLVSLLSGTAVAATSLNAGGPVTGSSDTLVAADGAAWTLYRPDATGPQRTGVVGNLRSGYWAGEIGSLFTLPEIGDEVLLFVEKTHTGSQAGYFGAIRETLNGADPALLGGVQLRPIPVPSVAANSSSAYLSWATPLHDGFLPAIAGFHVHRSTNGTTFSQITAAPIRSAAYIDHGFTTDPQYYAISLVYQGSDSPAPGTALSFPGVVASVSDGDTDGDGMDDAYEMAYGLQLNDASDKWGDLDGDGIFNYWEWRMGTYASIVDETSCPGFDVVLVDKEYLSGYVGGCVATNSISAGQAVVVRDGADVEYAAPSVRLFPGFNVEDNGVFRVVTSP